MRTLNFSISGEFITRTAREWFFIEHKPYSTVEELLLSCMTGTTTPEGTLKIMAQDILLGRAEFRGNSGDGTFCYVRLDDPSETNLFTEYSKLSQKYDDCKKDLTGITEKYLNVIECLSVWAEGSIYEALEELKDDDARELFVAIFNTYGGSLEDIIYGDGRLDEEVIANTESPSIGNSMLESYLQQQRIERKFSDNYGWLDPTGNFTPVEWGEHQVWAFREAIKRSYISSDSPCTGEEGDVLISRGWVLLHSPSLGVPVVTENPAKPLTKAQREFLFAYYSDRGLHKEAEKYLVE